MKTDFRKIGIEFAGKEDFAAAIYFLKRSIIEQKNAYAANDLGVVLEKIGEYEDSIKAYEIASNAGVGIATANLGLMYQRGRGTKKDISKAKELFEKSLSEGTSHGYFHISYLYAFGVGVERDLYKATELLRQGSEVEISNNYPTRKCTEALAGCYYHGYGCDVNKRKAFELYEEAKECNTPENSYYRGICYVNGEGTRRNVHKGIALITKAALDGERGAVEFLAKWHRNKQSKSYDLDLANFWLTKGLDLSSKECLLILAESLITGENVEGRIDKDEAANTIALYLQETRAIYSDVPYPYKELKEHYPNELPWDEIEAHPEQFREWDINDA